MPAPTTDPARDAAQREAWRALWQILLSPPAASALTTGRVLRARSLPAPFAKNWLKRCQEAWASGSSSIFTIEMAP